MRKSEMRKKGLSTNEMLTKEEIEDLAYKAILKGLAAQKKLGLKRVSH